MIHKTAVFGVLLMVSAPSSTSPARNADLIKSVSFYASFDTAVEGDFGGGALTPSTRANHKTEKGAFVFAKGFPEKAFRIAAGKGIAGGALEAVDVLPDNGRIFFPARGNIAYRKGGWGGTVSMWISHDPDKQLKTRFCDPVQITQKGAGDGAIWFDFNDAQPHRNLRMGTFPAVAEGRPQIRESREAFSPMVWIDRPGLKLGEWRHVALVWRSFDTGRNDARAALYLDGKLVGEIREKDYPISMDWDLDKTGIYVVVNYIGLIDEFALFNRALTEDEISVLRTQPAVLSSLRRR
jgi:Concanavalin A-like lectin/glucanases superfamily